MKYTILLLAALLTDTLYAQDVIFSQYYAAGLFVNPAEAGLQKDFTISASYRSQWKSVDMPFETFQVSCIYPLMSQGLRKKHLGGIALTAFNDVAGASRDFTTNGLCAATAYNFQLNSKGNNILAFAMQGGLHQRIIKAEDLLWSSQYIEHFGFDRNLAAGEDFSTRTMYPVLNAGIAWSYHRKSHFRNVFGTVHGFSASNLNRPNESVFAGAPATLPMRYQLHGALMFSGSKRWEICPAYLVRYENGLIQTNTGAYANYNLTSAGRGRRGTKLILGAWYRLRDSFIITTGIQKGPLTCGVSYDRNTTSFSRYMGNAGAFEVSAAFAIRSKHGMKGISTPLI
ncbi:PorP/SprF family type IX secretion system membrane protein [Pseudochryseolinea flava]|uniref:PorP/SprF family type IX secretion system membrane protein n=1 Tax=Pseudochryseolinea flava TaxID=2059302 RepID=UPI0014036281|nr:PorP/SprF family type IX secretion system membrane protein [Pseudochryseolinea flava]